MMETILASYNLTPNDIVSYIQDNHDVNPLFLCVTGSHMWNLAREDSDLDIRGIYVENNSRLLSLYPPKDTIEAIGILGGKVDLQLYEVVKALRMMLNNNGNIIELLTSPTKFYADLYTDWSKLAESCTTRQLCKYYEGYYHSQRKRAAQNRGSKALLYSYRELMAGIWLMRHHHIIHDFWVLREKFYNEFIELPLLDRLLESDWRKIEQTSPLMLYEFQEEWNALVKILHSEVDNSTLPAHRPDMRNVLEGELGSIRMLYGSHLEKGA